MALNVSKELLTWMVINKEGEIITWDFHNEAAVDNKHVSDDFETDFNKLSTVFEEKIPKNCQAYIFESRRYKTYETKYIPLMIKINRYEIILQSILKNNADKMSNEKHPSIYTLNRSFVAAKFRMVVGSERVMSIDILKAIQNVKKSNYIPDYLSELSLNNTDDFYEYLNGVRNSAIKESLAKNYLQASCFFKKLKYVKYFKHKNDDAIP